MLKVSDAAPVMLPPRLPVPPKLFALVIAEANSATERLPAATFIVAAPPIVPPSSFWIPTKESPAVEMLPAVRLTEALDPM